MRVHVLSDLHLEFGALSLPDDVRSGARAELVLLAGDIHVKRRAVAWAAATFVQTVCLIGGNHEAYGDSLFASIAAGRKSANELSTGRPHPIRFMEQETYTFSTRDGTRARIIAATLWTNFEAFGLESRDRAMTQAEGSMNDFRLIRFRETSTYETRTLAPSDLLAINATSREFLKTELATPFDGLTIVMTHHAPSLRSVPPEFSDDLLTAAYASNEERLIEQYQPALWVHGHIHSSADYRIGRTRIVCNPRGYFPNELNPSFDPACTIDI